MLFALTALQSALFLVLVSRLIGGRTRRPPEAPILESTALERSSSERAAGGPTETLTMVVATLNEAHRIGPCLEGLRVQGAPVTEILIVDSGSTDGTRELVMAASRLDPRIRLVTDPPLPAGWIGKAWALQHGTTMASNPWVLGMDADTQAAPGCAAATLAAAKRERFDVVSFAPRFDGQTHAERFVQPSLLVSLVYRSGAPGDARVRPDRVIANGQCFLARRSVILQHGGYEPVRQSFAEDVSLVRHLAARGVSVGFLDGSRLYRVRSYSGVRQMWREWGRSIDLKDAATSTRQVLDTVFVVLAQGAQLPIIIALAATWPSARQYPLLVAATAGLLMLRSVLHVAIRNSYEQRGPAWWLSPLSDPLAAVRMVLSSA
ncbi:MAG: glycosyltransferase family 2 protein, partial [Gemmatimonadaceae bacterium]